MGSLRPPLPVDDRGLILFHLFALFFLFLFFVNSSISFDRRRLYNFFKSPIAAKRHFIREFRVLFCVEPDLSQGPLIDHNGHINDLFTEIINFCL